MFITMSSGENKGKHYEVFMEADGSFFYWEAGRIKGNKIRLTQRTDSQGDIRPPTASKTAIKQYYEQKERLAKTITPQTLFAKEDDDNNDECFEEDLLGDIAHPDSDADADEFERFDAANVDDFKVGPA